MGRLFGTDGIRGIANKDLTCELATQLGRAAAQVLTNKSNRHPRVLIGKDTRLSSDMLENAMAAGLCSIGASVVTLGVVPTPAVAYLVEKYKADAGIMISASHNSFEYNGIKIFSGDGFKLPDDLEERIEDIILGKTDISGQLPADGGIAAEIDRKAVTKRRVFRDDKGTSQPMGEKGGGVLFVRRTPGNLQLRQHAPRAGRKSSRKRCKIYFFVL